MEKTNSYVLIIKLTNEVEGLQSRPPEPLYVYEAVLGEAEPLQVGEWFQPLSSELPDLVSIHLQPKQLGERSQWSEVWQVIGG